MPDLMKHISSRYDRVFILGLGFQKCGTSWLYKYLQQSQIFDGGFEKEYHIWDAIDIPLLEYNQERKPGLLSRITRGKRYKRHIMQTDEDEYFDYFTSLYDDQIGLTADITPSYSALSSTRMSKISEGFRERGVSCKAVLLIRDPVNRIKSAVRYNLDRKYYREGIKIGENNYFDALKDYYITEHCSIRTRYDETIQRVYESFDPSDVYVGIYENMFQSKQLDDISSFLGIDVDNEFTKVQVNKTKTKAEDFPDLENEIRKYFDPVYQYCYEMFPETRGLWR